MPSRDRKTLGNSALLAAICLLMFAPVARAAVTYTVTFDDPTHLYAPYYDGIRRNLLAAGADWGRHFDAATVIRIRVRFDAEPTMSSGSTSTAFAGTFEGKNVYEMRAAAKLLGHVSADDPRDDAVLNIGIGRGAGDPDGYLLKSLWFDPEPARRTAAVPHDRSDAYSGFLHELGHIFVFNGFLDPRTGAADPAIGISTFDRNVRFRRHTAGGHHMVDFFFTGPAARALYGRDVPLTSGCYAHFGNAAPRPGGDLVSYNQLEVMNGVTGYQGTRYQLSPLDLAVCADAGLPVLPWELTVAPPAPPQPAAPPPAARLDRVAPSPGDWLRWAIPWVILIAIAYVITVAATRLRQRIE